jgi:hypothetical protein
MIKRHVNGLVSMLRWMSLTKSMLMSNYHHHLFYQLRHHHPTLPALTQPNHYIDTCINPWPRNSCLFHQIVTHHTVSCPFAIFICACFELLLPICAKVLVIVKIVCCHCLCCFVQYDGQFSLFDVKCWNVESK